jgi:hypothetical protein
LYRCGGHRRREDQRHGADAARMSGAPADGPARAPDKPVEVRIRPAGSPDRDNS